MPVYTLLVQVGRAPEDGLPAEATGAALVCYAAGRDEPEAVRETVETLRQAGLAPLDVQGYGSAAERAEEGDVVGDEDAALMARAEAENAVVVAQLEPLYD